MLGSGSPGSGSRTNRRGIPLLPRWLDTPPEPGPLREIGEAWARRVGAFVRPVLIFSGTRAEAYSFAAQHKLEAWSHLGFVEQLQGNSHAVVICVGDYSKREDYLEWLDHFVTCETVLLEPFRASYEGA